MAKLADMAKVREGLKPTIACVVTTEPDAIVIRVPRTVDATQVRDKYNDKTQKTSFTVVAMPFGKDKLPAAPVEVTVTEGETKSKGFFAVGTVNLMLRDLKTAE